ncbi:cell division protein ZapA [Phreatobacter sp.]|uniref:cell division protein ZapA n=1 Tax=Phreatobacter sp. TaxID=1966341 RepID=UPI003F70C92D
MAHVSVTINGRQFRMACDDGQEGHLLKLADDINARIDQLKGSFGEIGDTRLTVMAAIMVADELVDVGRRLKTAEQELASLREQRALTIERMERENDRLATMVDQAAETVERLTDRLTARLQPEP